MGNSGVQKFIEKEQAIEKEKVKIVKEISYFLKQTGKINQNCEEFKQIKINFLKPEILKNPIIFVKDSFTIVENFFSKIRVNHDLNLINSSITPAFLENEEKILEGNTQLNCLDKYARDINTDYLFSKIFSRRSTKKRSSLVNSSDSDSSIDFRTETVEKQKVVVNYANEKLKKNNNSTKSLTKRKSIISTKSSTKKLVTKKFVDSIFNCDPVKKVIEMRNFNVENSSLYKLKKRSSSSSVNYSPEKRNLYIKKKSINEIPVINFTPNQQGKSNKIIVDVLHNIDEESHIYTSPHFNQDPNQEEKEKIVQNLFKFDENEIKLSIEAVDEKKFFSNQTDTKNKNINSKLNFVRRKLSKTKTEIGIKKNDKDIETPKNFLRNTLGFEKKHQTVKLDKKPIFENLNKEFKKENTFGFKKQKSGRSETENSQNTNLTKRIKIDVRKLDVETEAEEEINIFNIKKLGSEEFTFDIIEAKEQTPMNNQFEKTAETVNKNFLTIPREYDQKIRRSFEDKNKLKNSPIMTSGKNKFKSTNQQTTLNKLNANANLHQNKKKDGKTKLDLIKSDIQVPKYEVDLKPLNYNLEVNEKLKIFKTNNEFLFKETKEEKDLKVKIQSLTLTPNQIMNE